jgi:ABC-2 type transport system ATP-binding protein
LIAVKGLRKKYGSLEVLKGISFEIEKGSIYGFLGPNGAGKTTTMNILSGLIDYDEGEILFEGIDLRKSKRKLMKKIGYLPQNPVFYGYMNAYEYLNFIGSISGMNDKQIKQRVDEVLEIVKLQDAAKRKLSGYSGGMKQRFGIAVAIFNNPEMVFLDEPTSSLDPEGRMEVLQFTKELGKGGTTVFLSTHILNDVERVCDRVSILDKGEILISDSLENLISNYTQPIFDIELDGDCNKVRKLLANEEWVQNIAVSGNKISVYVGNPNTANGKLLRILADSGIPVISFRLRKSTLEDIFIRMVNKSGNV